MPEADSSPPGSVAQIRPDEGVSVFDSNTSLSIVRSRGIHMIGASHSVVFRQSTPGPACEEEFQFGLLLPNLDDGRAR